MSFVLTVLELGSMVSIRSVLQLLTERELIETVPILTLLYERGGFDSNCSFIFGYVSELLRSHSSGWSSRPSRNHRSKRQSS